MAVSGSVVVENGPGDTVGGLRKKERKSKRGEFDRVTYHINTEGTI